MLASRLRSAFILIALVLGFMYLDVAYPLVGIPGVWMIPFFAILSIGTVREAGSIAQKAWGIPILITPGLALLAILFPAYPEFLRLVGRTGIADITLSPEMQTIWARLGVTLLGAWGGVAWMGVRTMRSYQSSTTALGWLVSSGLLMYLCVALSCWWIIRQVGAPTTGMLRIIGIATVTKMSDAGAYFVGKTFGNYRLVPLLSPKKTWEGFLGGIAVACLVSVLYFSFISPNAQNTSMPYSILGPIALGILLAVGGLFGDLIESMLKRSGEVKDSGSTLPGLGGIWDVSDSLIPAGVVGLLAIAWGWI